MRPVAARLLQRVPALVVLLSVCLVGVAMPSGFLATLGLRAAALAQPAEPPHWKVVYVVGVVDTIGGPATRSYVDSARDNAAQLRTLGLQVQEFYPPDNHWPAIRAAANDADILIYSGHGVSWGGDPPLVGGLLLQPGEAVHPDQVRVELHMAANAVAIMSHICYAAGVSAEDAGPIAREEAERRVAQYSLPFLDAGISGYYANMYGTFPVALVEQLLGGDALGRAYEGFWDFGAGTVERHRHPQRPAMAMWLDKDDWNGMRYNYAFVGDENLRLAGNVGVLSSGVSRGLVSIGASFGALAYVSAALAP
ncbi:MAG: hypothetical protein ACYC5O_12310 [Anaerolineae bacterium]